MGASMPTVHVYRIANRKIGHGHAVRCLALSDALSRQGWQIIVHESMMVKWVMPGDVNVVDIYDATAKEILTLRELAPTINLNDKGSAKWFANMSFLHTTYLDSPCPADAPEHEIIAGTEYAILRPEFAAARKYRRVPTSPPRTVFVAHGGSDPMRHTEITLKALERVSTHSRLVSVVLGSEFDRDIECTLPGLTVYRDVSAETMARLMAQADLGICSMGLTTHEACCMGLPTINLCFDEYLIGTARIAEAKGLLWTCPPETEVLADAIERHGNSAFHLKLTSRTAMAYVPGRGATLVARDITQRFWKRMSSC